MSTDKLPVNPEAEAIRMLAAAHTGEYRKQIESMGTAGAASPRFLIEKALTIEAYNRDACALNRLVLARFGAELLPGGTAYADVITPSHSYHYRARSHPDPENRYLSDVRIGFTVSPEEYTHLRSQLLWINTPTSQLRNKTNSLPLSNPRYSVYTGCRNNTVMPFFVIGESQRGGEGEETDILLLSPPCKGININFSPTFLSIAMWTDNWEPVRQQQNRLLHTGTSKAAVKAQPFVKDKKLVLNSDDPGAILLEPASSISEWSGKSKIINNGMGKRPSKRVPAQAVATAPRDIREGWGTYEDIDRYRVVDRLSFLVGLLGKHNQWLSLVDDITAKAPESLITQLERLSAQQS